VDALFANWSGQQLLAFLLLCGIAGMISTICAAYSYRIDDADHPAALNSRIRGTISLIVTLLLLAGALWVHWKESVHALDRSSLSSSGEQTCASPPDMGGLYEAVLRGACAARHDFR